MAGNGGGAQPPSSSQAAIQDPVRNETVSRSNDEHGGQRSIHGSDKNDSSGEDVDGVLASRSDIRVPLPATPSAPMKGFPREEIVNEVLDLTDQLASVALFGPIGIGKSFVARTVLDHDKTKAKFGPHCHFMRCDGLADSLEAFLERISEAIRVNRATSMEQLQLYLESSPPLILLLDAIDFILELPATGSQEILAAIEDLGGHDHVCVITTSRAYPKVHGFHRVEVPVLTEDCARDAFYNLCDLGRSSAIDNLIARLDFHPLSIELLASSVLKNNWDESTLLKECGDGQASVLSTSYHQGLRDVMEPALRSPTIRDLGTTAWDVLEAIAAFPSGVGERGLEKKIHKVAGIGKIVNVLCESSLIYRQDELLKMLSPFRFYFLESMMVPAQTGEVIRIRSGPACLPAQACTFFPFFDFIVF